MSTLATLILVILLQGNLSFAVDPVVQLPNGQIRGREAVTIQNKTYYAFEKIPYAAPPIGELRFKPPQPAQNWEGVLNTTYLDVSCYQEAENGVVESEDCLFINVFTPMLPNDRDSDLLPVMFFIHGGGFANMSSILFKSERIIEQDVIYVSMNYRLGAFGFMSTEDEVIPGNYALKDQLLALQWAHDNINLFGGDPEKITIFGQSAGSASVSYQLLHQESQGLFRAAITQSGSSLSPWAYQRNARQMAFGTGIFLNESIANKNDSAALLDLFQSVSAEDLREAAKQYRFSITNPQTEPMFQGLYWAPVIEAKNPDAFITKKMFGLIQAGNVVKVPLMTGMTSEESLGLYPADQSFLKPTLTAYDKHVDWLVSNDTHVVDEPTREELGSKIREIYTQGEPFLDHLGAGIRFFSDSGFTKAIIKHAQLYSKVAPTYFYQFSYDGELGQNNIHYDGADAVGHSEELYYMLCTGQSCDITSYPESDQITSQRLIKLWTDFAKYLNPTPEASELLQNVTWPQVNPDEELAYLDINENLEIKTQPKQETYSKWNEIYNSLNNTDFDTY